MSTAFQTPLRALALAALASGCIAAELPGSRFDVSIRGDVNDCTATPAENRVESHEYRLEIDGLDIVLAIGEDEFAVGEIDGCNIEYETVVVTDYRNDSEGNQHEIRWKLNGEATIDQLGGVACLDEPGVDWEGTETITVIRSQHPAVDPGCTYTMDVTGRFTYAAGAEEEANTDQPQP